VAATRVVAAAFDFFLGLFLLGDFDSTLSLEKARLVGDESDVDLTILLIPLAFGLNERISEFCDHGVRYCENSAITFNY